MTGISLTNGKIRLCTSCTRSFSLSLSAIPFKYFLLLLTELKKLFTFRFQYMCPPIYRVKETGVTILWWALLHHLSFWFVLQEAGPLWASAPDGVWLPGSYGLRRPSASAARSSQLRPQLFDPFLQRWVLTHGCHHPQSSLSAAARWDLVGAQCLSLKTDMTA